MNELFIGWQKKKKIKIKVTEKAIEHFLCLLKVEAHMKLMLNIPIKQSEKDFNYHID